ncbi:MAG TPA: LytTR family DNA-binding domain-containing protein [Ginsengibacter sp.]
MIRALIIDDEEHCIEGLQNLLVHDHKNFVEVAGNAKTVRDGIGAIALLRPDLVFLDVQIGEKTGFDLLRALPEINFEIIFTTAFEKFALQAIRFSALDYLLKPIDPDDLDMALIKLSNEKARKYTVDKIDLLLQNTHKSDGLFKKIIVPTISGFEFLEIGNIIRCESDNNYTTIYIKDKQKMLVSKTLKDFEELLSGYSFFRIHNSHLINLSYIKTYNKGKGGSVILTDGTEVEVSSRRKDDFIARLSALKFS